MHPQADLSLGGFARLVAELLERLDLREVTLVQNDHGAALALAGQRPTRVARLVISSCEAFENYPPGLPGRNLRPTARAPGGLFLAVQALRLRWLRRLPVTFGWMSKRPVPDELVDRWLRRPRTSGPSDATCASTRPAPAAATWWRSASAWLASTVRSWWCGPPRIASSDPSMGGG
jgi:pimeloyl-ACP methyl ester carboxylesterase